MDELTDRDLEYLQMGRASMIPGFQRAINLLQEQLDLWKAELYQIQGQREQRRAPAAAAEVRRLKQPRKQAAAKPTFPGRSRGSKSYWAKLTPEERRAEMKRRADVAQAKKTAKLHPSNKNHPDHEKWRKSVTAARRKEWAGMSVRQRKQRLKKLKDGKAAKAAKAATPLVTLERTA